MYVCMYVCMYVGMYYVCIMYVLCMYACMYVYLSIIYIYMYLYIYVIFNCADSWNMLTYSAHCLQLEGSHHDSIVRVQWSFLGVGWGGCFLVFKSHVDAFSSHIFIAQLTHVCACSYVSTTAWGYLYPSLPKVHLALLLWFAQAGRDVEPMFTFNKRHEQGSCLIVP